MEDKEKPKRGFAVHPENINKGGRPKGSRNKSTLLRAQLQLDSDTEDAAALLGAIMRNDTAFLGISTDVPLALRQKTAIDIMNKSIANEKDKEPAPAAVVEEEDETPIFSLVPVEESKVAES